MNTSIKSKVISKLEQDLKVDKDRAIEELMAYIKEAGTPIVKEIDDKYSLVTFIYLGDETAGKVILVPGTDGWRKPEENTFKRIEGTNVFYDIDKMPNDVMFDYRICVDDSYGEDYNKRWDSSIPDPNCPNRVEFKDDDGNVKFIRGSYTVMENAPKLYYSNDMNIPTKGTIEKKEFESKILGNKRIIYFYLPYGYSTQNKPYKVLVLTDGTDYLSPMNTKNVLDNLIYEDKIPPIAAIFISQTDERDKELACNDKFVDFITKEVLPWARDNYNFSSKPQDNIIGGLSFGGLTAMYTGLRHSDVFGNVLSQSGSFWWSPGNNGEIKNYILEEFQKIDELPLKIYMETGIIEDYEYIIQPNEELRDFLQKKDYDVEYSVFKAGHDYLLWGENLANGLVWLLGEK